MRFVQAPIRVVDEVYRKGTESPVAAGPALSHNVAVNVVVLYGALRCAYLVLAVMPEFSWRTA